MSSGEHEEFSETVNQSTAKDAMWVEGGNIMDVSACSMASAFICFCGELSAIRVEAFGEQFQCTPLSTEESNVQLTAAQTPAAEARFT